MDYVYVGKIVQTHGIKGELRIKSNFEYKDKIFRPGFNLYLGKLKKCEEIVTYRKHKDFDMVTFKGYDNINQVLSYLKTDVYVKREDLQLKDDQYVLEEVVGFSVVDEGEILGKVDKIVYNNGSTLLEIVGSKHFYIPCVSEYIKSVKVQDRVVLVENAKGLML